MKATSDDTPLNIPLTASQNLFPVVGIGASAGGLDAFKKLLKAIPENSGMAYVLVQHLDPNHESLLPEILQKVTNIPVIEIADDIKVLPDHIYVIPSNKMMVATDGVLLLAPRPVKSKNERNLPIDLFFASLAEIHQEHAIGVVLSGTASDGTQGLKAIKEHGGITFAQDEASAEYDGMPNSAVRAGVVDFVLPPGEIPKKLLEVTQKTVLSDAELQNIPKQEEDVFRQILSLLRIRKGVDFTYYKQTTVRRRILRRMVVNKNEEPKDYLNFLRTSTPEQDLLYQDMLIPVTSFFRDPKVFENLCQEIFPAILKDKVPGQITRIWVAGCSTGQEVYSFAMCFKEFLGDNHEKIQIFGTDLSEPAILKARSGIYEKAEIESVSPVRLKEFFTLNNGAYQINKSIRDLCVFALHNFLKDPPFGKMDCISCRNVLIYMEPYLQKKAITTFHYALNPKGFLLLGKSETTGGLPDLFSAVAKSEKLYTRKDVPAKFIQVTSQRSEQMLTLAVDPIKKEIMRIDFQKTADDILLSKYTPASVIVNESLDIVHFRGNTTNYLEQAPGKPSHNLLIMAKNGLGFELRNVLHKAKTDKLAVVKENIPVSINGQLRSIDIEAIPLPNTLEPYYLVLFHDPNLNDTEVSPAGTKGIRNKRKISTKTLKDEKEIQIQLLEQELAQAREDMRSITEDQEASNEELQSANEELLSGSEELQSLNEELETSKEELQSTNEELTVLNHELSGLNEQITDARNYSESIIATLYQPLLVLDKHLRVKTANKAFYKTFKVNEQETEGLLIYDLGNRQWNIPELRTLLEEVLPQKKQISDFEVTHNFLSIGERIILLNALEITREKKEEKLILLSIEDITEKKLAQKRLEENEHRYHMMLMNSPFAFSIMKGKDMVVTLANDLMKDFWGKGQQVEGKPMLEILPELIDQPFPALFDKVYTSGEAANANEILARLNRNGVMEDLYFNIVYQPHLEADKTVSGVITIAHEVTNQVLARKQIEDSNKRYNIMLLQSPFAFAILKGKDMVVTLANDSVKEMWGKGKDLEGKPLIEVLPELKNQQFPELLNEVYTSGIPYSSYESLVVLQRNGKTEDTYFNFTYQPYREADETISGVVIIATEVTPQAILNKKIKASEEKFKMLVQQAPVAICVLRGEDYVIEVINKGMYEMWDRTLEETLNKPAFNVLPELREQGIKELLDNVCKTGKRLVEPELSINLKRNEKIENVFVTFVYEPLYEADGSISGVMCLAHEITEQVMARKKVEESETKFRTLIKDAPVATCLFTGEDMTIEIANDLMIRYWGKDKNVIGQNLSVAVPELIGQPFLQILAEVYATGKIYESKSEPTQLKINGTIGTYYFDYTYKPILNAAGKVYGILNMAIEVTEQVLAVNRIKESEARFRTMADDSPLFIFTIESDGLEPVSYWNQTWLDFTGQTCDQAMERNWDGTIHPDDLPLIMQIYTRLENNQSYFIPAIRVLRYDGDYRWHSFKSNPRHLANGDFHGFVGVGFDIHEQKLAEDALKESTQQFTSMADNISQLAWMMDAQGWIYWYNQRWYDYTGTTFKEVEGWGWQKLLQPEMLAEITKSFNQAIALGTDWEDTFLLRGRDKQYKWFLSRVVPIKDAEGKVIQWFGTHTDVTEQKEANKKAQDATNLAENAMKAKQQFFSNMSHEIRTPMNAIVGFTGVMLKTALDDNQKKYLNAIQASGDSLIVLINDILDLAKVDAGKMTFQRIPFQLSASITAMLNLFEVKIQEKNIQLIKKYDGAIPQVLLGDPARLHQIIINLIGNSLKFTEKGLITVDINLLEEKDDNATIEFAVTDTGIGISESNLVTIFDAFQQATSETSQLFGGTGLGLSIVKQLVESQGGTLSVQSKEGKGSTFSFILNFEKTAIELAVEAELVAPALIQNLKVLVVEDVKLNQMLIKIILEDLDIAVDIAENGKIAMEMLKTNQYDIIFMDLQMPEMNGYEATEYIRNTMNSQVPIIALTADVTNVDLEKCKAIGMDDYISKPIDEK
ncbi:MAG: PAS domain-containing protein, partial [Burkholderiales bacterium]|nr:PAS domain-containing protein [Flavobacterium sp.]